MSFSIVGGLEGRSHYNNEIYPSQFDTDTLPKSLLAERNYRKEIQKSGMAYNLLKQELDNYIKEYTV